MKRILLFVFLLGMFLSAYSQSINQTWSGYLKYAANDSLRFVLNLQFENDTLREVTFDSPDQMTYNIKATKFSLQNDTLQFAILNIGVTYKGIIQGDEFISGVFAQGGKKQPLLLQPSQPVLPPNRPQTPQPPFPYIEEEINMNDHKGEPNIKGTLSLPEDGKIKATLILITGSGWQDRDETMFFHKPFKVIADYLTRNGYAVYRCDDLPAKVFSQSTTLDFVKNVQTIVKYFQKEKRTKNQPIGLLGHSEGGLITFLAAANNSSIDFIISLAGNSEKMNNVLLYQIGHLCRVEGFNDMEIEELLEFQKQTNQLIEKAKNAQEAKTKFEKLVAEYNQKWDTEKKKRYHFTTTDVIAKVQQISNPWFLAVMKIDPANYIKKVKSPVYAMVGEKDLQIYYKTNLEIIEKNLPKKTPRKIVSFPNLNHLLQNCETGSIKEYGIIEETISPKLLDDILLWLNELFKY
jgi:esterase/lipase